MAQRGSLVAAAAWLAACSGRGLPPAAPPPAPRDVVAEFGAWESGWLEELAATDPRVAARTGQRPSAETTTKLAAAAVLRGDPELGTVGGGIDVFSFGTRDLELHRLGVALSAHPDDGSPATREELSLLGRLLEGEELRVARERLASESGSERVTAILAGWPSAAPGREVIERERLIERGLGPLLADATRGELQGARALELEDALDALERAAVPEGYPEATRRITSLRVELGRKHAAAPPRRDLPKTLALDAQLVTYLGGYGDRQELQKTLSDAEATLAGDARSRLHALTDTAEREALVVAASHVDEEASCDARVTRDAPGRSATPVARAMKPPPERALVCEALVVAAASGPDAETVAAVVLHDDVAIALWALAIDGGSSDLDATRAAHTLIAAVAPDRQDRLARAALVSPVRAIAPAVAATCIDAGGPSGRKDRAARWLAYGDAPFDLVLPHLAR